MPPFFGANFLGILLLVVLARSASEAAGEYQRECNDADCLGEFEAYIELCGNLIDASNGCGSRCKGSNWVEFWECSKRQVGQLKQPTLRTTGHGDLIAMHTEPVIKRQREVNRGLMQMAYTSAIGKHKLNSLITVSKKENGKMLSKESSPPIILGAFGGCFVLSCAFLCPCVKHRRKAKNKDIYVKELTSTSMSTSVDENSFGISFSASSSYSLPSQQGARKSCQGRTFALVELKKATSNFSPTYKIGQGGFGVVYKGKLNDGTIVAIKRAKKGVCDSCISSEFENEVNILLNVDHMNLVKLIGYVEESNERFLVTEYVPNGNLREHLDCAHGVVLDLSTRLDICIDVAHALTYLHLYADKPIIHRDVKSSNILLTDNLRAKVADFGYSHVGPLELGDTHVSTQVKGTAGYLDPEYLRTYRLTEKSDVYSFGVLLVEIVTARRPIEQHREMKEKITLRWAFRLFLDEKFSEVLDPRLKGTPATYMVEQKLLELAFQCSSPTKQDRPNMKRVVEILWGIRKDHQNVLQQMKSKGSLSEGILTEGIV